MGGDLGFDLSVQIRVRLGDRAGVLSRLCLLLCHPCVQRGVGVRVTDGRIAASSVGNIAGILGGDLGFDVSVQILVRLGDRAGVLGRLSLLLRHPGVESGVSVSTAAGF